MKRHLSRDKKLRFQNMVEKKFKWTHEPDEPFNCLGMFMNKAHIFKEKENYISTDQLTFH